MAVRTQTYLNLHGILLKIYLKYLSLIGHNLGKRKVMLVLRSLLTTLEASSIVAGSWDRSEVWLEPKIKLPNQVKLVHILLIRRESIYQFYTIFQ